MRKLYLMSILGFLSMVIVGNLEGSSFLWIGADGNLIEEFNWSPLGPPWSTDTGVFDTSGSHSPYVVYLGNKFIIGTIRFTDSTTPYTFNISPSPLRFPDESFFFYFDQDGVMNLTPLVETFNINFGELAPTNLIFTHTSSADFTSSGKVVYNIDYDCSLLFFDSSTASNATINAIFEGALVEFFDDSDPNRAIINLHFDSSLNFSTTTLSSHGGPFLTLFDTSEVNVNISNRIASLNSISTASAVNIETQTLSINLPAGEQDLYAGAFNGTGVINVAGANNSSSLTLTGNSCNFTGTINVYSGQVILGGSLGGLINVFSTLYGTGRACNTIDVKNGGVICPCDNNNIGTLTVGNYINSPYGTYLILVNGSGNSILITQGTAIISGGTVIAASPNGPFLVDTPYMIVHAEGGRIGEYTRALQEINPFLVANLSYDQNNVFLTLNTNFAAFARTENQKEVADQLDSITSPSACQQEFLQDLLTLTPSRLRCVLDELSREQYTSIFPTFQKATDCN